MKQSGNDQTVNQEKQGLKGASRKKKPDGGKKAVIAVAVVAVLAAGAAFASYPYWSGKRDVSASVGSNDKTVETAGRAAVLLDGQELALTDREAARRAILERYPWQMQVTFNGETYEVADLLEGPVEALLEDMFGDNPEESYTLELTGLDQAIAAEAKAIAELWSKPAVESSISGYDANTDTFLFSEAQSGVEIDQEQMAAALAKAVEEKRFDAVIEAAAREVAPADGGDVQSLYKTIGSFSTTTTANQNRNTNINLACQSINGTILQPGEEFSFNGTVGQRTVKKGYKGAAAYNNGEVVQETGGGVCQVSTTLYNATVAAGLEITSRRSHTFEPSYVTPGQDATVSWPGPDYCFKNNSDTPIGIRANYNNRKVTISIYGKPILEEGVEYSLKSRKLASLGAPAPTYVEDLSLPPGAQVVRKSGSGGSKWETRLVITKNGQVVSEEVDHTAVYKGHNPVVARNTTGIDLGLIPQIVPSEGAVETQPEGGNAETSAPVQGPGVVGPGSQGPGVEAESPEQTQAPSPGPAESQPAPAPAEPAPAPDPGQQLSPADGAPGPV